MDFCVTFHCHEPERVIDTDGGLELRVLATEGEGERMERKCESV